MSNLYPLASIITPSYNQAQFLEQTILSVLSQDYPNLEYIVMDGGSTDGSVDIIRKYENRLAYWVSEKDNGQADAINKGWRMARGEFIAWLNSDDVYMPGAIRRAVDVLGDPDLGMIYGNAYKIDAGGNLLSLYVPINIKRSQKGKFSSVDVPQPSTFFRKDVAQSVGYLNPSLNYCMDYDLFMKITQVSEIAYAPYTFSKMRLHRGSKSSRNIIQNMQEKISVLKEYQPLWFFSRYYWRYLRHKYIWMHFPGAVQRWLRRLRGLPHDRALM